MLLEDAAGVTAALVDPSALFGLSGPAYAGLSFLLVLLASVGLLVRRAGSVDRAVDHAIDGLPLAAVYGVVPFALVTFVGGYVLSQSARAGVGGPTLVWGVGLLVVAALVMFAGFGYLVIGAYLTEIEGARRPWPGAVVGAAISAVPWLLLPTTFAALVWFFIAAIGLGGTTQEWVHGERTVESEAAE